MMRFLLDAGAGTGCVEEHGQNVLHETAMHGDEEMARAVVGHVRDLDRGRAGGTSGRLDMMFRARDAQECTPMELAIWEDRKGVKEVLAASLSGMQGEVVDDAGSADEET